MSKYFLGIDIRADNISAVLVKNSFKETRVEAFEHVLLSDQDQGEEHIAAAIQTVTTNMDLKGAACIASIPSCHISFRNLHVPFKDNKKIRQILPFEVEPSLPYPVEDLILDFYPYQLSPIDGNTELVTAAVKKTTLTKYLDAFTASGLELDRVTINGYAAAQLVGKQVDSSKNMLYIDMDRQGTTLFAGASGRIFLVRFIPENKSGIPAAKHICSNIVRTLTAFSDRFGYDFSPEEIYISNQGKNDRNFHQEMSQILELPVKQVDHVRRYSDTVNDQGNPISPGMFNNAAALTVSEIMGHLNINFLQGDFAPGKTWVVHKKSIVKTAVIALMTLLAIFFNIFIDTYYMEKKLARTNSHIANIFQATFPDVKRIIDPLQQMRVKMQNSRKAPVLPDREGKNVLTIDILYNLSRLIPEDINVNVTRLVVGAGSVVISGDTDTFNSVDHMKSKLDKSKLFSKVTINSADMDKGGKRVRFKMKIQL